MNKISTFIGIILASGLLLSSCQQDIEVWDSETYGYDGRYVIKLMNEDMSTVTNEYDGSELQLYNTAANQPNELWMEDMQHLIPLKSKFTFTGTPNSFKSSETDFDKLANNILTITAPTTKEAPAPTAENQTAEVPRDDLRATILDGKIIAKAVKTKGGNVADSLYLKVKLYGGIATFKSKAKPKDQWQNPNTAEYIWVFTAVRPDPSKVRTIVIGGYRYTGFAEDEF